MRKKVLSAVLTVMMIASSITPAFGAEFSDGGETVAAVYAGQEEIVSAEVFTAGDSEDEFDSSEEAGSIIEDGSSQEAVVTPEAGDDSSNDNTDEGDEKEEEPSKEFPGMQTAKGIVADQLYQDTVMDTKDPESGIEEGDYERFQCWYQFVPEEDGIYTLGGRPADEFLYACARIGTKEDYNNDSCKFSFLSDKSLDMEMKKGEVYYIEIFIRNATSGIEDSFSMMLRSPEPQLSAEVITEGEEYRETSKLFSSYWYQFVPVKTGYYVFDSDMLAPYESSVSVYEDSKLEEEIYPERSWDNELIFPLTKEHTYYVRIEPIMGKDYSLLVKRKLVSDQDYIEDILEREGALTQLKEEETGKAETDAVIYKAGETERTFMQFIPKKTGRYSICFYDKNDESSVASICLYDSNFKIMAYVANIMYYNLEAGEIYYIANDPLCDVEYSLSECAFSVEAVPSIMSIKVLEEPENKVLYKGCMRTSSEEEGDGWLPGIKLEVGYEDGKTEVLTVTNGEIPKTSHGDLLYGAYDGIENVYRTPSGKYTFTISLLNNKSISAKIEDIELKDITDLPLLNKDGTIKVKTNFEGDGWIRFKAPAAGKYVFSTSNERAYINVYEDTLNEDGVPCIHKVLSETNSAEAELESGKYYYIASKLKGSGEGDWTDSVTISVKSVPKVELSKAKVTVASTAEYTGKAITPTVKVTYENTTLKKGTDYTVSYSNNKEIGKATVTLKGKGNYTGTVKAYFNIKLGAPNVKSAVSAGYNAAKVTWDKVPGAKTYSVYYKGGSIKSWKLIKTGITGTSYKHVSSTKYPLTTGTVYTYTVKAVKGSSVSTYGKSTKEVKVIPATVKLGKVTSVSYNQQKISWTKVSGATGYVVYQKINNKWKSIGTTKATSYINKNAKDHPVITGVTNTYTVRAYRKVGSVSVFGDYSKTGSSGKALLDKPVISQITATSKGLKLQWKKVNGAAGYVIQRYESGKWVTKKTIKSSKTLSYTDTTAKKGTTYKYRIKAYCNVNGKPFYSVYSETKSKKR